MNEKIIRGKVYFHTNPAYLVILYLLCLASLAGMLASLFLFKTVNYGDFGINLAGSLVLAVVFSFLHFSKRNVYTSKTPLILIAGFLLFPILIILTAVNAALPYTLFERVAGNTLNQVMNGLGWLMAVMSWIMVVCCLVSYLLFLNKRTSADYHKIMHNTSLLLIIFTSLEIAISLLSLFTKTGTGKEIIWIVVCGLEGVGLAVVTYLIMNSLTREYDKTTD